MAVVLSASLYFSFFGPLEKHFQRGRPFIEATQLLHERDDLCGVAIIGIAWANTGGHAFLNRSVPFYLVSPDEDRALEARPYNYAMVRPEDRAELLGYQTIRCWEGDDIYWQKDRLCVVATRRSCSAAVPEYEANQRLRDRGQ